MCLRNIDHVLGVLKDLRLHPFIHPFNPLPHSMRLAFKTCILLFSINFCLVIQPSLVGDTQNQRKPGASKGEPSHSCERPALSWAQSSCPKMFLCLPIVNGGKWQHVSVKLRKKRAADYFEQPGHNLQGNNINNNKTKFLLRFEHWKQSDLVI